MSAPRPFRARVTTRLPVWLWNFNPVGYGRAAGLHVVRPPAGSDASQLQTNEAFFHTAPSLVALELLAGPGIEDRLDRLDQLDIDAGVDLEARRPLGPELDRIRQNRPNDFAAEAVISTVSVTAAPHGQLGQAARESWQAWTATQSPRGPAFPDAAVHVVKVDRALQFRTALSRILLRAESDPSLYAVRPANANQPVEHFSSARDLLLGLYFLDPYLAPILVGNAPYVWAFTAPRPGAQVVFSLGKFANGTTGEPAEPLQMFGPPSILAMPSRPQVSGVDISRALAWWVRHLNALFGLISDPVLFTRADGFSYSSQGHMQTLLTVEQLFRHVQSILTQVRDKHARRLALFGFLDTWDGLLGRDLVSCTTLSVAGRTLDKLKAEIDPMAAKLLIPPAERAIDALKELQRGFVLRTDEAADVIRLPTKRGIEVDQPIEKAAASYLYVLRNATHGFGGKNDDTRRRNEALLASHSGELPDDLPMLAYLYLLSLVNDPTGLRMRLQNQVSP